MGLVENKIKYVISCVYCFSVTEGEVREESGGLKVIEMQNPMKRIK